jgi:myo-inositol-1(or 4)-monophosphatase
MALTGTEQAALLELVQEVEAVVLKAGQMAMTAFRPGERTSAEIRWKEGSSPVTSMDLELDRFLSREIARLDGFSSAFPRLAYHSEEDPATWRGDHDALHIVTDPIDGTRGFMNGRPDWCISVGLVWRGEAVGGVVNAPARGDIFAASQGSGALRNGQPQYLTEPVIEPSASGPRGLIEEFGRATGFSMVLAQDVHALAHRLVRPLSGDFAFAFARTGGHDWDLAAADAILSEAGGVILDLAGQRPVYALEGGVHSALIAGHAGQLRALVARSYLTGAAQAAKRPA